MKLRSFIPPGDVTGDWRPSSWVAPARRRELAIEARRNKRLVGSARVLLATEAHT